MLVVKTVTGSELVSGVRINRQETEISIQPGLRSVKYQGEEWQSKNRDAKGDTL